VKPIGVLRTLLSLSKREAADGRYQLRVSPQQRSRVNLNVDVAG
jgi:hypothetical protein